VKKKRLIFTLFFKQGYFYLSRNFQLQKVGDMQWLMENYNFGLSSQCIDELMIINVGSTDDQKASFIEAVGHLSKNCFVPVTAGGGIRRLDHADELFTSGADKVCLNYSFTDDLDLVERIVSKYGRQSIVASLDVVTKDGERPVLRTNHSTGDSRFDVSEFLARLDRGGYCGELYLTSVLKDGTGQGLDECLFSLAELVSLPVIIAGGAGLAEHLYLGLVHPHVDAVATANLFNFLGPALEESRNFLIKNGIPLANFTGTLQPKG